MNVDQEQPAGINAPVDYSAALLWVDGDRTLLAELIQIFFEDCPQWERVCAMSGKWFRGRVGLFEIFEVDEEIRDLIMQRKPASFIRSTAIMKSMKTMFQDGLAKAFMGETTIEEVFRVALGVRTQGPLTVPPKVLYRPNLSASSHS